MENEMVGNRLVVFLIHGIGPQADKLQDEFLAKLEDSTKKELAKQCTSTEHDPKKLQCTVEYHRVDWSAVFADEKGNWLRRLFPKTLIETTSQRSTIFLLAKYAGFLAIILGIVGLLTTWFNHSDLFHSIAATLARWKVPDSLTPYLSLLVVYFICAIVIILIFRLAVGRILAYFIKIIPWSYLGKFSRPFEAYSASDIILYMSPKSREKIIGKVLSSLLTCLDRKTGSDEDDESCDHNWEQLDRIKDNTNILLIGHSLGSLIAYDLVHSSTLSKRNNRLGDTRAAKLLFPEQRCLDPNQEGNEKHDMPKKTKRALGLLAKLRNIGLVTMGSPLGFFLFRNPGDTSRKDMWQDVCPMEYREKFHENQPEKTKWHWFNFWHEVDFIAHRAEPFFNKNYPNGKFIEDAQVFDPVQGPLDAHSVYWRSNDVSKKLGTQVAQWLTRLADEESQDSDGGTFHNDPSEIKI